MNNEKGVFIMDISWGDVPTWLAMAAAGFAGWKANSLVDIEQRRDEASSELARRAQASRVSAWVEPTANRHTGFNDVGMGYDLGASICIANLSSQPVYDIALIAKDGSGNESPFALNVLPPENRVFEALDERMISILRAVPGLDARASHQQQAMTGSRLITKGLRVELTFRDVEGRTWRRNGHGILEETSD